MGDQNQEPSDAAPAVASPEAEPSPKATPAPAKKSVARRKPAAKKAARTAKPPAAAKAAKAATAPKRRVSRFVVLFRHGLAEEHSLDKPDGDRSLTEDGHLKTKRAARGLQEIFPEADTLFSSPLVRAMQTALWLTKAYRDKLKVQVTDALLPGADPAKLAELIASQEGQYVVVVGHEPHLTDAFAKLVGISGTLRADLRKAGCIGIRLDERGKGTL